MKARVSVSPRAWLASDAVQTVIARVVAEPRGTLVSLDRDDEPHLLLPEVTARALAVVLADAFADRVDTELTDRYAKVFATEHAADRAEGLREAAADLRKRAERCRRNGGAAIAPELVTAAGSLEVRASQTEAR